MAVARAPLTYASASVAVPGTTVGPTAPVPDNCTGIGIQNTGSNPGWVAIGTPGGAALGLGSATYVAAGAAVTLPVGTTANRGIMDQSQLAGSGLVFDATGGATAFAITYINALGSRE